MKNNERKNRAMLRDFLLFQRVPQRQYKEAQPDHIPLPSPVNHDAFSQQDGYDTIQVTLHLDLKTRRLLTELQLAFLRDTGQRKTKSGLVSEALRYFSETRFGIKTDPKTGPKTDQSSDGQNLP